MVSSQESYKCPVCEGEREVGLFGSTGWLKCDFCNGTGQVPERRSAQRRKQGRRDGDMPGSAATSPGDGRHPQEDNTAEETRLTIGEWQMHDVMVGRHALLQEAVELLKRWKDSGALYYVLHDTDAFLEKINHSPSGPLAT